MNRKSTAPVNAFFATEFQSHLVGGALGNGPLRMPAAPTRTYDCLGSADPGSSAFAGSQTGQTI